MAKAREVPGIRADALFRDAAAAAVAVRAEEVFEHAEGVLDMDDIERVHDMRVATRRLRGAMEIFAPCFPKAELGRELKEVKALADALGERRDPDVAIEELRQIAEALPAADRPGVESLIEELRDEQRSANVALRTKLSEIEERGLRERLTALAEEARTA
jgi:CHAD domain-containing protein